MTREEAERCYRDRTKVVTSYGLGEIYTLCSYRSPVQWAEIMLDKDTLGVGRHVYLSSISVYVPAD
jgi:hypothetical protein